MKFPSDATFLLAPDSFKGSLSAIEVCDAMRTGIERVFPAAHSIQIPLADGGEGTLQAVLKACGGQVHTQIVRDPLSRIVRAQWAILPDNAALIEMAQSSGLTLVAPHERDILRASSYGVGQLMRAALDAGCRKILIGVGGSATNDGGAGALQALGARFLDEHGRELPSGGAALQNLQSIDLANLDARLKECAIKVLCDVNNPLCGSNGATHVYGPQKGASVRDVQVLDAALEHLAQVAAQQCGVDNQYTAGAGAAGGIAYGLMQFCGARLAPGIEAVMNLAHIDEKIAQSHCVFTAEGAIDAQTLQGKVVAGVCRRARSLNVPVLAFGGAVNLSGAQLEEIGLASAFSITNGPLSLENCIENANELLSDSIERVLRLCR